MLYYYLWLYWLSPFLTPSNHWCHPILVQHIHRECGSKQSGILHIRFSLHQLILHCSPSPSSQSSTNRTRLPSVDITSISHPLHILLHGKSSIHHFYQNLRLTSYRTLNPSNTQSGKARVPTWKSVRKAMSLQYWNAPRSCRPGHLSPMRN